MTGKDNKQSHVNKPQTPLQPQIDRRCFNDLDHNIYNSSKCTPNLNLI